MRSYKQFLPLLIVLFLVVLTVPASLWLVLRERGEIRSRAASEGETASKSEMICAKPGKYCRPCCPGAECIGNRCVLVTPTSTPKPTPTPTKLPLDLCNRGCNLTTNPPVNCEGGLICWPTSKYLGAWGVCRNPSCPESPTCVCVSPMPKPTPTLRPTPTPTRVPYPTEEPGAPTAPPFRP